jgi:RHS repeat-associated protein
MIRQCGARDYDLGGTDLFGARYYDPSLGRWTQQDPTGQDANPYAYVDGDPVNVVDPSGLHGNVCSWSPDRPFGFNFHDSCHKHDFCYRVLRPQWGTDRGTCDSWFRQDLDDYCDTKSGFSRWSCRRTSNGYYNYVRIFGS